MQNSYFRVRSSVVINRERECSLNMTNISNWMNIQVMQKVQVLQLLQLQSIELLNVGNKHSRLDDNRWRTYFDCSVFLSILGKCATATRYLLKVIDKFYALIFTSIRSNKRITWWLTSNKLLR